MDEARTGDIAVHVQHGEYEDWLLSSSTADTPMALAPWRFTGARAFIRLRGGEIERVTLIGGHQLDWADQTWPGKGIFTGQILATLRRDDGDEIDGFLLQGVVPPDAAGTYLKVEHPAGTRFGYSGTRSAGLGDARSHPLPYTRLYPILSIDSTHPGTSLIETGLAPEFDLSADGGASLRFYPHLDWDPDVIHQGHIMFIDHAYAGNERKP